MPNHYNPRSSSGRYAGSRRDYPSRSSFGRGRPNFSSRFEREDPRPEWRDEYHDERDRFEEDEQGPWHPQRRERLSDSRLNRTRYEGGDRWREPEDYEEEDRYEFDDFDEDYDYDFDEDFEDEDEDYGREDRFNDRYTDRGFRGSYRGDRYSRFSDRRR